MFFSKPMEIPPVEDRLQGRPDKVSLSGIHAVSGREIKPPYAKGLQSLRVGMGCFWGVERLYWPLEGIWVTAAGYAGGTTKNPSYEEVCGGYTAHTEIVHLVYDPEVINLAAILQLFWENHDPTQGMRQGNDKGTQYRSAIYLDNSTQLSIALASEQSFQEQLSRAGLGQISTEIRIDPVFYFAEEYHQQYLHKNPGGYCNLRGTGVHCIA